MTQGMDPPDGAGQLRAALVDQLIVRQGIDDARVLAALRRVPRHRFVPEVPASEAYADVAIVTRRDAHGTPLSSSSQPAIMALMLEQLAAQPGQHILEIGTGTGYNAALLAEIVGPAGRVTTVDIDAEIVAGAAARLADAGYPPERVRVAGADGALGWPEGAPFDRIVVTAAAWNVAPAWADQLRDGGRLVVPLTLQLQEVSVALERQGRRFVSRSLVPCGFLPLRGSFAGPEVTLSLPGGGRLRGEPPLPAPLIDLLAGEPRVRQVAVAHADAARLAALLPGPVVSATIHSQHSQHEAVGAVTPEGDSACFALPVGPAQLTLFEYGAATASLTVDERLRCWAALGALPLAAWQIILAPADQPAPAGPGVILLAKPGWQIAVAFDGARW